MKVKRGYLYFILALALVFLLVVYFAPKLLPSPGVETPPTFQQFYGNVSYANGSLLSSGTVYALANSVVVESQQITNGAYGITAPNYFIIENLENNVNVDFYVNVSGNSKKVASAAFSNMGLTNLNLAITNCGDGVCDSSREDKLSCPSDCNSLVLDLEMDEGSGNAAFDSSGYGNNGSLTGGVSWVNGISGKALSFNGVNGYVKVLSNPSINFSNQPFSTSIWVKYEKKDDTKNYYIYSKGHMEISSSHDDGFRLYTYQNKTYGGIRKAAVTGEWAEGIIYNKWVNYVTVFNGSSFLMYRDGSLIGTDNTAAIGANQTFPDLYIGSLIGQYKFFNGSMDEFKIWNKALSQNEITQEYRENACGNNVCEAGIGESCSSCSLDCRACSECPAGQTRCYDGVCKDSCGGNEGGGGGGGCTATCVSSGFNCGIHLICGANKDCGNCTSGTCNSSGKCVVANIPSGDLGGDETDTNISADTSDTDTENPSSIDYTTILIVAIVIVVIAIAVFFISRRGQKNLGEDSTKVEQKDLDSINIKRA